MSTVSWVGSPSSSTLSDPRRQGMVPLSTTVPFSLANKSGKRRSFLAVEVGFQAVAYGFVQQHPRPAWTQHHFHVPCGGLAGIKLQHCLPGCFLGEEFGSLV